MSLSTPSLSALSSPSSPPPLAARSSPSSSSEEPDTIPNEVTIQLNLRKAPALAAHNRSIANLPDPVPWQHNWERDSFHILCARIRDSLPARLPGVGWPRDALPYVKPTRHATAKLFLEMDEDNFEDRLKQAWRMELRRLGDHSGIIIHIFAYLKYPDARPGAVAGNSGRNTGSRIQRAIGPRKAAALERINEAVNRGQMAAPGRIIKSMLSQRIAQDVRPPEPEVAVEVPETATFVQQQHLDGSRRRFERIRGAQDELDQADYRRVRIRIEGVVLPIEFDVNSLGLALGLPQFDMAALVRTPRRAHKKI